jgi:RNA polymerase sigma factor (sigma-70 family)
MPIEGRKEICLDRELLRIVQEVSRLEQKVTKLFELLRDPVYRYLTLVLGNRSDAEDLTQEVFLRFYTCLAKGQAVENVRAWLFRVAQNLAVDLLRKSHRMEPMQPEAWDQLALQRLDPSPDAELQIMEQEQRRAFLVSLRKLSPQERHCLYLRSEGLSYNEIAEILGIAATTVPTFLSRGIKKLRKNHD